MLYRMSISKLSLDFERRAYPPPLPPDIPQNAVYSVYQQFSLRALNTLILLEQNIYIFLVLKPRVTFLCLNTRNTIQEGVV